MKRIICTDVWRDEGTPLYTVKVYDIDTPVNRHSYDCVFYEQGRDLNNLLQLASKKINKGFKPSDEQMDTLFKYAEQNNKDGSILTSLYQELKKLIGE